jgi:hypothetical protein
MNLTASEITRSVLKELSARGCKVWRSNNLAVRGRKFIGEKGAPDVQGHNRRTGIALYCEIKAIGDKLSQDQINFLSEATDSGCITLIATEANGQIKIISFRDYVTGQLIEANLSELLNLKRKIA